MPVVPASLNAEQYKALLEYRQKLEQEGLCSSYETLEQLPEVF